ncbi:hypothetical protein [uncultured Sphaerotilus sp.]|uniref:hypothetical protein n=1 Tax=uncultured Sphaerotilus sp. TaxID=474984 RepID=UPI0030CA287C
MNVGNCSNANQQKVLEIGVGEDFVCPECHKSLLDYTPRKGPPVAGLVVGGLLLAALAGAGWWMYSTREAAVEPVPASVVEPMPTPQVAPPPPPLVKPVVPAEPSAQPADRLPPCGSNDDVRRRLKLCD